MKYKVKHAVEFLEAGKHVRFRVFLRGREMANPDAGVNVLESVSQMLGEHGRIDKPPLREGRFVNMYVVPANERTKN